MVSNKVKVVSFCEQDANNAVKITINASFVFISPSNIDRILNAYIVRKDEDHFSHLVSRDEIEANEYNISVSTYVEQQDTRETIDIHALNRKISEIVARQAELRKAIDEIVADLEGVAV